MKKSSLVTGIVYTLAGIGCLLAALYTETRLDGILWGFTGAGIASGMMTVFRYFYWTSPRNIARYQERIENERIEQHDELKEQLRNRSGRYAYVAGLFVTAVSMLVFSLLGSLGALENARVIVLYLGAYLVFQIVLGIVIFNRLLKKY